MAHTVGRQNCGPVVFIVALIISLAGTAAEGWAQTGAFGDLYPTGILAAAGSCDALRVGESAAMPCNPAHVAWVPGWSFAGGYRRLYEMEYLQRVWSAAKYCRGSFGAGFSLTRFGKEEFYTETEGALALAWRPAHRLAVGIDIRACRLAYTSEAPTYTGWSAGVGVLWNPISTVIASAAIRHALREDFIPQARLPRQVHLSAAATIAEDIRLGASWQTNDDEHDLLGLGQRILLAENVAFLSAVYFNPARYALGGEFTVYGQSISYCYLSHPDLGGTHYIEFQFGDSRGHNR